MYTGPNTVKDGLVFTLDGASRRSTLKTTQVSNNLVDPGNWSVGSGGSSGYGANGSSSEQNRLYVTDDPWGRKSVTWRTTPDATSDADGGWDSSYYSIDTNYTYRYCVWVRRYTSGTGGTFYYGMNPAPIRNDNDAVQDNPYWHCPSIASLTQNQWYLVVAYCFKESYTGLRHPESGYWYIDGNGDLQKSDLGFCNVGSQDVRWNPGTSSANHRVYHYYTTNTASGIEFAYPRMDKVDGNEPSINELMYKGESGWRDMVSKDVLNLENGMVYSGYDKTGGFVFDGTDDNIPITSVTLGNGDWSVEFVVNAHSSGYHLMSNSSGGPVTNAMGVYGNKMYYRNYDGTWQSITSNTTVNYNEIYHLVYVNRVGLSTSSGTMDLYINGVRDSISGGNSYTTNGGPVNAIGRSWAGYFDGEIHICKRYTTALSDSEVTQNYNAYKNRFDI